MFPNILTSLLDDSVFTQIKNEIYDKQYRFDLKPALVYNTHTHQTESHVDIRRSLKTTFTNDYIMELVSGELKYLFHKYNLQFEVIGHQDLLQYKKGDEFKFHKDLKNEFTDNTEIYTLIIGMKRCAFGGRTIIQINKKNNYYTETTVPGGLLMFKSLLLHRGEKVKCKTKEVLVLTVRVTKKHINYTNTSKLLSNFILCKKYISYICKRLPKIIIICINEYLGIQIFIDKKMTNTLFKCIKMNYTIPIQLSVHHSLYEQDPNSYPHNQQSTLQNIYISLFNGLKYRIVHFNNEGGICLNILEPTFSTQIKENNRSLFQNLNTINYLHKYHKIQNNTKVNKVTKNDIAFHVQPFDISDIQSDIDAIILKWFATLDYTKLINTDFEQVITHTYKERVMCNGGDDYDIEDRTDYIIHGLAIYYGFIIL